MTGQRLIAERKIGLNISEGVGKSTAFSYAPFLKIIIYKRASEESSSQKLKFETRQKKIRILI